MKRIYWQVPPDLAARLLIEARTDGLPVFAVAAATLSPQPEDADDAIEGALRWWRIVPDVGYTYAAEMRPLTPEEREAVYRHTAEGLHAEVERLTPAARFGDAAIEALRQAGVKP